MSRGRDGLRVAIFFGVVALIGVATLLLFAGFDFFADETRYVVRCDESISGLQRGAPVLLQGVSIGEVESVSLAPDEVGVVHVVIAVASEAPVFRDAEALLKPRGFTWLKYIDLTPGTKETGRLPPGGTIPAGETLIDSMADAAEELAKRAADLTATTQKIGERLLVLLEHVDPDAVGVTLRRTGQLVQDLSALTTSLRATLNENRDTLRGTLGNLQSTTVKIDRELDALLTNLNQLVKQAQTQVAGHDGGLTRTLENFEQASRSFKELAQDLRQRPSQILRSQPPQEREALR